jgi:hypothetical protein
MPSWKESGLERIGWGAYPHVLLKHFLVKEEDLGKVARLALRILIVYGEVTEEFLTKRLQKEYPVLSLKRERTIEAALEIKKSLRTFYSLSITNKFTLVYSIDSDVKQKWLAKKLKKLRLELMEGKENEDLPEEYKPTSYHGETIFG